MTNRDPGNAPQMRPSQLKALVHLTNALRSDSAPCWQRLRQRLAQEGVSVDDATIPFMIQDDVNLDLGYIVTRQGKVYEFVMDWFEDEDGRRIDSYEDARISEFTPVPSWKGHRYAADFDAAISWLAGDA